MGTKTVLSQTGSDNPTWGANAPTGAIVNVTSTSITRASNQFTSTSFTDIADDQSNDLGGLKEWTTDQDVDEDGKLDEAAQKAADKAKKADVCIPIGEGENCW